MSNLSQTTTVTLRMNGTEARKVLDDLKDRVAKARKEVEDLEKAKAAPKDIERARREAQRLQKQYDEARSSIEIVNDVLANLDKVSMRTLEKTLKDLNRQFRDAEQGSDAFAEISEKIRMVKEQIAAVKDELQDQKQESLWGRFKNWATDAWPALDLLKGWYDGAISTLRGFVDAYAEMDQEMASVRKYTGMSEADVAVLNEQFKKLDTRSSREQLNMLAQDAGRLGKTSVEDVMGFVRAADKINVALDDLGDGATLTLSKLTGIFGYEEQYGTEQSLLKVGSVINELSQNCSASAPYIANFTERMAGVGAQANMTIPQIMGLAAVLDSNSQAVEASATAISQVIVRLYQDPAKYAKVAGLDVKEFSDLLQQDANAALILFLETLNKAGGMDVLSPMFKDMGENGSRAIAALSTLAGKIEDVKAQQETAAEAFREGTSIGTEFDVQNNTIAAGLDKCKNAAHEYQVELGQRLYPLMSHFLTSTAAVARALLTTIRFIFDNKTAVINLTVAILAYVAAVKIAAAWTDIMAKKTVVMTAVQNAWTTACKLASIATDVLTGNVVRAKNTWQALNLTLKANPIGLVVAAVAMLATYIAQLAWKTDEYKKSTDKAMASATSFAESLQKEKSEIDKLFGALDAAKKGTKEYHSAKEAIISRYGVYLQGLINEKGEITNLAAAYDRLTWAAQKSAQARAVDNAKQQLDNAYADNINTGTEDIRKQLLEWKVDERTVTSIVNSIARSLAAGEDVPEETRQKLHAIEKENTHFYTGWFDSDYKSPMGVMHKMRDARVVHERNSAKLDKMGERQFQTLDNESLQNQIDALSEALGKDLPSQTVSVSVSVADEETARRIASSFSEKSAQVTSQRQPSTTTGLSSGKVSEGLSKYQAIPDNPATANPLSWSKDDKGNFIVSGTMSRAKANDILKEQLYEKSIRTQDSAGGNADFQTNTYDQKQNPKSGKAEDRFEKEKAWRAREEAEARIAYAKGESLYEDYQHEMAEIAEEYHQMLLDREDLSADERLSIQADYWEAVNKRLVTDTKASVEAENARYEEESEILKSRYASRLQEDSMSADERKSLDAEYKESLELAELEHLSRLVALYESGSDDRLKAQRKYQDAQMAAAKRHRDRMEQLEAEYAKVKDEFFGANAGEKQALYDKQMEALTVVYNRELLAAEGNAAEKLRIEKAFLEAQKALRLRYGLESEADSRNALQNAVSKSVEWLNSDGGKAVTQSFSTVVSGMSSVFSGLSTLIQSELQIQTAAIESRYDKEVAAAEGNSYRVAKLEKEKEAQIAKAKNEANRKMFAMQVIQALAQTATNALNAYGSAAAIPVVGHIMAPIAAAMAVAAGMVQVAAIKKQQQASETQGYSKGGFTKKGRVDEPAGIVHAGEWVASQKLLASPVARPMIEALDYAQRTNTIGSLRQEDVSRSITATQSMARIADGNPSAALVAAAMASNSDVLQQLVDRLNEPFVTMATVAGDHGINKAQDEYSSLLRNKSPKSKKNANHR